MVALHVLPPDHYVGVVEAMQIIIDAISALQRKIQHIKLMRIFISEYDLIRNSSSGHTFHLKLPWSTSPNVEEIHSAAEKAIHSMLWCESPARGRARLG
jgi:hypothetical protein